MSMNMSMIENTDKNRIFEVSPDQIFVKGDRHRQIFNRKPLEELVESMREVGQLQPGGCRVNEEGLLELLFGERRLKACEYLKVPFKYYLKEEITDPLLLEQIQLDENLCREDLDWKEEIKAKDRIHAIFQTRFGVAKAGSRDGHSLEDTASHIGIKKAMLSEDIALAAFLAIPEVAAASNKTTAKKIAKRMIEQVKRHDSLDLAIKAAQAGQIPTPLTEEARAKARAIELDKPKIEGIIENQILYFNRRCILGLMEEKIVLFQDESFDIVCFDPPWGVDYDKNKMESAGTKTYSDNKDFYTSNLPIWLKLIYQKMKPDSHLYMFFAIARHGFVYDSLEAAGFETHRIPIIWHKQGAHAIRNAEKWPGLSYEPIAFVRKGKKKLAQEGKPDVIITPMPTASIKDIHPSAKHPQVYKELLLRSALPGNIILDPMGGSGMFGVAAESLSHTHSLNWYMIEKDEDYRNLQLANLLRGYEDIAKREVLTIETARPIASIASFQDIKPGTEEWKAWWNAHPEDQSPMLVWRQKIILGL